MVPSKSELLTLTRLSSTLSILLPGKYDGNIITGAGETEELVLIVGRYSFDRNPFIGTMADINVWSRYDMINLWRE